MKAVNGDNSLRKFSKGEGMSDGIDNINCECCRN